MSLKQENRTQQVFHMYEEMETGLLVQRLAAGNVTPEARKIGLEILRARGEDPEKLIAATERMSTVDEDVSVVKGRSATACPFCGSTSISRGWKIKCNRCSATYTRSIFERLIAVLVAFWAFRSYRSGNSNALWIAAAFYGALGVVLFVRKSFYGTWMRGRSWSEEKEIQKLGDSLGKLGEYDQFLLLLSAIRLGHSQKASLLIKNNPTLIRQVSSEGNSPLMIAVRENRTAIAKEIIECGEATGFEELISPELIELVMQSKNHELIEVLEQSVGYQSAMKR